MSYSTRYTELTGGSSVISVPALVNKTILFVIRQGNVCISVDDQGDNDSSMCYDFDNTTGDIDLQTEVQLNEVIQILWKD